MNFGKLLITGGTGFFGKAILKFLAKRKEFSFESITVISRNPQKFLARLEFDLSPFDIEFIQADLTSDKICELDLFSYDYIIHAATESSIGPKIDPKKRFLDIVDGTRNILEVVASERSPRFLLVSSGGVYGQPMNSVGGFVESEPAKVDTSIVENAYSVGKIFSEHLAYQYNHANQISLMVARCFSFIGEDLPLDEHFAIGNFINNAIDGRDIVISGDGSPIRSYLYQDDLAEWLLKILCYGERGEVFNVGSDEFISIGELAQLVQDASEREIDIVIKGQGNVSQSANRNIYYPNIKKAEEHLGLQISNDLISSISKTIRHHKGKFD